MASEKKTVCLRSSDGEAFEVSEQVIAAASVTIKGMIGEASSSAAGADTTTLPIPNVTAATLSRVLDYVNKHSADIQLTTTTSAPPATSTRSPASTTTSSTSTTTPSST
jgi:hypothetical protein